MRKIILPILIITLILFGISFYLQSIDHSTKVIVTKFPYTVTSNITTTQINGSMILLFQSPLFAGNITETSYISPPSYANLWPETLAVSVALLALTIFLSLDENRLRPFIKSHNFLSANEVEAPPNLQRETDRNNASAFSPVINDTPIYCHYFKIWWWRRC